MPDKTSIKPRHLGRGLESLLGPIREEPASVEMPTKKLEINTEKGDLSVKEISLDLISPNPYQARTHWNEEKLKELASSIEANGIVQPIVVRQMPSGFQLIAGERRFRASKMIGKATIPAVVRNASEEQMLELALVENIHRADLNPIERAKAYQSYIKQFELTQTEAAKRLGEDRSVVSNYLRILELPADLRQMLAEGKLTVGHAKTILSLPTDELRIKLSNRAMAGRLSVRELEKLVDQYLKRGTDASISLKQDKDPHVIELEGRLTSQLGSRVRIETKKKGKRGHMIIEFNTLDEFDLLLEKLGVQCSDEI